MCGEIQIIFGPMFSGKTSMLIERCVAYAKDGKRVVAIKYAKDTRYAQEDICTHDFRKHPATPCTKLSDVVACVVTMDVVGIDEGQFMPDLAEYADLWASQGKTVIIAALDGTFQRKQWPSVAEVLPLCEHVTKLMADCDDCGAPAAFTKRTGAETTLEVIGGSEKYQAACRACFACAKPKDPDSIVVF